MLGEGSYIKKHKQELGLFKRSDFMIKINKLERTGYVWRK